MSIHVDALYVNEGVTMFPLCHHAGQVAWRLVRVCSFVTLEVVE